MKTALLVILALAIALAAGIAVGRNSVHTPKPVVVVHTADQVDSFNDGFMTGKSDCR